MSERTTRMGREDGVALLVTVILLLLVSAIGLSALNRAGDEQNMRANSTRKTTNLAAAEAGMSMLEARLALVSLYGSRVPVGGGGFMDPQAPLNEPALVTDEFGFETRVHTGSADSTVEQPIFKGRPRPAPGGSLNEGAPVPYYLTVYRASLVARDSGGGVVQVQSQWALREQGGYN